MFTKISIEVEKASLSLELLNKEEEHCQWLWQYYGMDERKEQKRALIDCPHVMKW